MSSLLTNKINKVDRYIIDELIKEEKGSLYKQLRNEWCFYWFQYIKDNPNISWNYYFLSENPMTKGKNDFIKNRLIECYKSHYSKVIKVHEELIAKVLKTENLGDNADEQVKRLEELGFNSDDD